MKVQETTPPIQRTFDLTELNSEELAAIRKALSTYSQDLETDRRSQNEQAISRHREMSSTAPVPQLSPSEEEILVHRLVQQIREVERAGLK